MLVRGIAPFQPPLPAPAGTPKPVAAKQPPPSLALPTDIPDGWVPRADLPANAKRVAPIETPAELMSVTAPVLPRPVLMVHGLAQHADTFANLKTFLCSEPSNHWGGVYETDRDAQFVAEVSQHPDANVFAIDISDNLASPRVVANEVRRAIDAITKATGAKDVDVITHSMGSLVTREAIHQGEGRIRSLLMISPPNHGAYEATLASTLHDSGIYGHYPEGMMGAMNALSLEFDSKGRVTNQWLHDLNTFWANDPNRPRATVVTGVGIPTPDRGHGLTSQGDGMVAARQAPLDGSDFLLAVPNKLPAEHDMFRDFQEFRYNHLQVVSEPEIYRVVSDFLGATPSTTPTPAPAPPAPPGVDAFLNHVQDRTRDLRSTVVNTETNHRHFNRWQQRGTVTTAIGAGLTVAAGLAPGLGTGLRVGLVALGAIGLGVGAVMSIINSRRLSAELDRCGQAAEESLDLSDELVHRVIQERQDNRPSQPS